MFLLKQEIPCGAQSGPDKARAVNRVGSPGAQHIIIRADGAAHARLHRLLGDGLGLPIPWPVSEHSAFTSAGIFAGNVDFELLDLKRPSKSVETGEKRDASQAESPAARLYGIVFECVSPFDEIMDTLDELRARHLPYLPVPYVAREANGARTTQWHNIFFGKLVGDNRWMDGIFLYKRLHPDRLWMRIVASGSSNSPAAARFMFDTVYRDGIVFAVKYNPAWRDIDAERRESEASLRERDGGRLGLVRVASVQVGVKEFRKKKALWEKLLAPHPEGRPAAWSVGSGPELKLVECDRDGICSMTWEVKDLNRAESALKEFGIGVTSRQVV